MIGLGQPPVGLPPAGTEPRPAAPTAATRAWRLDGAPSEADLWSPIVLHALAWLLAGCAVGLLLATLLLAPDLGQWLGTWTYGRWAALHLDLLLYGWLALPVVGLLLHAYRPPRRLAVLATRAWSASLLAGAASWLAGQSSGKLFLDWAGPARLLFLGAQVLLAITLLVGYLRQVAARRREARDGEALGLVGLGALWLALLAVPLLLAWATGRHGRPPVDPTSGGATGGSLVGSTLLLIGLTLAIPWLLGLPRQDRHRHSRFIVALLAGHLAVWMLMGAGDRSNHEPGQVLGLASLAIWAWLLPRHLRTFRWPAGSRPWLLSATGWGLVLLGSSLVLYLPPVLDRLRFTDGLVAHAHAAMAGLASSLAMVVLVGLAPARGPSLARPAPLLLWQGGLAAQAVVLTGAGILEARTPALTFHADPRLTALYLARWVAGALMLAASACWIARRSARWAP